VRPYLENTHHKKGLVEWLKQHEQLPRKNEALNSVQQKKKKKKKNVVEVMMCQFWL
jgi:hypothetical protein